MAFLTASWLARNDLCKFKSFSSGTSLIQYWAVSVCPPPTVCFLQVQVSCYSLSWQPGTCHQWLVPAVSAVPDLKGVSLSSRKSFPPSTPSSLNSCLVSSSFCLLGSSSSDLWSGRLNYRFICMQCCHICMSSLYNYLCILMHLFLETVSRTWDPA